LNLSGIDCDINLNNPMGIRNTHLLKCYSEIDWRVKPLILNIKRWAKFQNINDASKQTVSSYCLSLMTIFFLQSKYLIFLFVNFPKIYFLNICFNDRL
jgi:poly(A) RNA polymerase GLD2